MVGLVKYFMLYTALLGAYLAVLFFLNRYLAIFPIALHKIIWFVLLLTIVLFFVRLFITINFKRVFVIGLITSVIILISPPIYIVNSSQTRQILKKIDEVSGFLNYGTINIEPIIKDWGIVDTNDSSDIANVKYTLIINNTRRNIKQARVDIRLGVFQKDCTPIFNSETNERLIYGKTGAGINNSGYLDISKGINKYEGVIPVEFMSDEKSNIDVDVPLHMCLNIKIGENRYDNQYYYDEWYKFDINKETINRKLKPNKTLLDPMDGNWINL